MKNLHETYYSVNKLNSRLNTSFEAGTLKQGTSWKQEIDIDHEMWMTTILTITNNIAWFTLKYLCPF